MRNDNDRIKVKVHCYLVADLDLERVEEDPRWQHMSKPLPDDPEAAKKQVQDQLFSYINQYILSGPQLLTNAPFTNGPSDVWVTSMERISERPNAPVSESD